MVKGNYFDAVEILGVLRKLNAPGYCYYRGMAKEALGDYKGAAEAYSQVNTNNPFYKDSLNNLARAYTFGGNYTALDKLYAEVATDEPNIIQLENRMNCIVHMFKNHHNDEINAINFACFLPLRKVFSK